MAMFRFGNLPHWALLGRRSYGQDSNQLRIAGMFHMGGPSFSNLVDAGI